MNIVLSLFWLILSTALTRLFYSLAQDSKLMDKPNDRSLHIKPVVRGGGLVFIGLSLISLPLLCYFTNTSLGDQSIFLISIILLAGVSFLDDLYNLSAKKRLLIQCIVAGLISLFMKPDFLDFTLFSFTNQYLISGFLFFAVIWAINHFNFMDGIDGFCASQAIFLFVSYALLFHFHDALIYQDFCLILVFSLIGFLIFNFPPAKLFMGDIGSASLGLINFCIAIIAQQKYQIPILYWFLLNSLFLFDATVTLIRRILNKEKWSSAHRKHAYQRLKQLGVDTRLILLGQALINSFLLIGIVLFHNNKLDLSLLISSLLAILLIIYCVIEKLFPMNQNVKY